MKRLMGYAKPYRIQIIWMILSGLGCALANVAVVEMLKQLIDKSVSDELFSFLPEAIVKVLVVVGVGMVSNHMSVRITGQLGARLLKDMRCDLVRHIECMPVKVMEQQNFGDMMERCSSDVAVIAAYMQSCFRDCLYIPIMVFAFVVYLFWMSPMLAVLCLGPLFIMVPLSIRLLQPVKMAQREYVKQLGLTNNHIQEAFDGAEVIKAYGLQKERQQKYEQALRKTLDISNKNDLWQYNIEPLSALIREAPTAITLCIGGALTLKGAFSLGILVAFMSGIRKINDPLSMAYQLVVRTQTAMISANRIFEILDISVEGENDRESKLMKKSQEVFDFQDVCYGYTESGERNDKLLKHIRLSVKEGKRVALVGRSGCGKSTILKLLCRQYEASSGEIYFYGNPFRQLKSDVIRNQIACIAQEAVIFPLSIEDNIRIGKPEADSMDIITAATKAGCHDFIMELPQGYDTLLEERGNNLSGGQRQRIAITRALLKDAPILLLDEPTAALDAETEKNLNKTLLEIAADKTMITVAHRLHTIVDYDEILVLEDGKIVEAGTHEELMRAKGMYFGMYQEYIQEGVSA